MSMIGPPFLGNGPIHAVVECSDTYLEIEMSNNNHPKTDAIRLDDLVPRTNVKGGGATKVIFGAGTSKPIRKPETPHKGASK